MIRRIKSDGDPDSSVPPSRFRMEDLSMNAPSVFSRFIVLMGLLTMITAFCFSQKTKLPYQDPAVATEQRVEDLLARMTVEEKVTQLQCTLRKVEWGKNLTVNGIGGIGPIFRSLTPKQETEAINEIQKLATEKTRLGIPIIVHDEALHGLVSNKATSFPQAIGLAATWDVDLMSRVATVIGKESRSRGVRQVLSPVVNIARDVRWGRVEETYGEDPYLQSRMAVAFCRSIEGEGVLTTPKHFIANVGDGGRDSYPASFTERELREVYFPPFKAAFQEAKAWSVMSSYNSIDGTPASSNKWLLTDVLRKEWGFKGFVVSDYGSVAGIKEKHFVAATPKEGAIKAVEAGLDMELPDIDFYGAPLLEAAKDGSVSMKALDDAVRNILRAKFRLGLFEKPYSDPPSAESLNDAPDHRALAREAARKAIVLLRNENNVLPLKKGLKTIAVIGPNADIVNLGGYSGFGMKMVSLLEGIRNNVGSETKVVFEKGCETGFSSLPAIASEFLIPEGGQPGEHGLKGEYFKNKNLTGNPDLVRIDKKIDFTWAMGSPDSTIPADQFSVRWTGSLTPSSSGTYAIGFGSDDGVRFWIDGKLIIDSWYDRGASLDQVSMKLEGGRVYKLKIEYYENTGWAYASLVWDMKRSANPMIQSAVEAARKSEVALVAVGITEGEGYDRASLDLPGQQEELIRTVSETGTPTIVVLISGSAVTMKNWIENVAGIVDAWYPGEEGGNAIADVLFGEYNPGGKLPITFPQTIGQVPLYYNHKPTGRGDDYTGMSGKPLFPFGFGLSYSTFVYSNLEVKPGRIPPTGTVQVTCEVQNTSMRQGEEVVQLYLHDPVASVTRPLKELRGFKRVALNPGEKRKVTFSLGRDDFGFLDARLSFVVEPGTVEIMLGRSSDDIRLRSGIDITK
jgi:beta-glucosidase